jgi:predicted Zn-ribbon and HTH transcriptional regulator
MDDYAVVSNGESHMPRARCRNCGFEAPASRDDWARVDHPPLGTLTQCPECGSTDVLGDQ